MNQSYILLLLLHVMLSCTAFRASPLMQLDVTSSDASSALEKAAQILNVPMPGNWPVYMQPPSTTGSTGSAHVGIDTIGAAMSSWSIPNEFRDEVLERVKLIVLAATEGSYTAQAFVFDIPSGAFLSTLLVVVKKLDSPVDPNLPVAVAYLTINSNAQIKQQYTRYTVQNCHRCGKRLWQKKCCNDEVRYEPRGNTLEEVLVIKQKMTADQFIWFSQQPLSETVQKHTLLQNNENEQKISLTEAIEKFLSNSLVRADVFASYNDSILSTLQSNIGSLKLSSQSLKMAKVASPNLPIVLSTLAKEYGFENITLNPYFPEQLQPERFSYEYFFTTSIDNYKEDISMKYILMLGQSVDKLSYTIHFLCINITSQELINTLLSNDTNTDVIGSAVDSDKQIRLGRVSTLNDDGDFFNEYLSILMVPWQLETTKTALNILRFTAASTLVPQKYRMLSSFNPEVILSSTNRTNIYTSQLKITPATIIALSSAVSAAANAWKDVASAFRSTTTTTITKIVQFGFTYFAQKSTILKVTDIAADRVTEFINALVLDYNLPTKGSFALGLKYSDDFAWDCSEFLYSPAQNGIYRSLTLLKSGNSLTNTASFIIIDINADWQLAPDLLLIQTSKSRLGGLFQKNEQSIQEVPHSLTMDEVIKLQQFFLIVAMVRIGPILGLNVTYPALN